MTEPKWKERVIKAFSEVGIECEEAHDTVWIPSFHNHEIGFAYFSITKRYVIGFHQSNGEIRTYATPSFEEAYKIVLRYIFEDEKPFKDT